MDASKWKVCCPRETAAPSVVQSSRASDAETEAAWLANLGELANQTEHAGS